MSISPRWDSIGRAKNEKENDEEKQRALRKYVRENDVKTVFLVRDELKRIESEEKKK